MNMRIKKIYRVGSRMSPLAIAQTAWAIEEIRKKFPNLEFEIIKIKTKGDILLNMALDKAGGKGLYIKELESALIEKSIDFAVHSMKDMPVEIPKELSIYAVSSREDARDVLVSYKKKTLEELKEGSIIGTSSARREVQVLKMRPDLKIRLLRGNVLTRIKKLDKREYDGIIIAAAGLNRLGLKDRCAQVFSVEDIVPAPGQGILCIEARKDNSFDFLIESVHCKQAALQLEAERAFMKRLGADCSTALGAYAFISKDLMNLTGMYAPADKRTVFKSSIQGKAKDATLLGNRLAENILSDLDNLK
ncbi:MAG: hydroxymethylbilane synthase [Candidatus Humimicrobiaceae bacterium]